MSAKEAKKIEERERMATERAAWLKAQALRDDDNVFDVAYEKQGDGTDTLSATDIKVRVVPVGLLCNLLHACSGARNDLVLGHLRSCCVSLPYGMESTGKQLQLKRGRLGLPFKH